MISLAVALLLSAPLAVAGPGGSMATVKGKNLTITYEKVSRGGKQVFGTKAEKALVTYGEMWRSGDTKAPEIKVAKASLFGGRQLSAGTFLMFVLPEKDHWNVILNTELKQDPVFDYDKVKSKTIIQSIDLPVTHLTTPVDQLTMSVTDTGYTVQWGDASVFVPVKPFPEY